MSESLQPVLFGELDFVRWTDAEAEVRGAAHLLNEKIYKKLAVRIRRKSENRIYRQGELYSCQELFRDSHVKGLSCMVSPPFEWRCCDIHDFISVGEHVFKLVKKDGKNQRLFYALQHRN
jgi:hypothetical protein